MYTLVIVWLLIAGLPSNEAKEASCTSEGIQTESFRTVQIKSQTWMAENLNVTHFQNGDPIPQATSPEDWIKAGDDGLPMWTYFEFNPNHGAKYGKLYNWFAVMDERGIAPQGWRVPSFYDWAILSLGLGGADVSGRHLKSTKGWKDGGNGTNSSGFNGLPAGVISWNGEFYFYGVSTAWWSTTEVHPSLAYHFQLYFRGDYIFYDRLNGSKSNGKHVRLIRE
jgi:uncharacterized protein (TIGR02145 family)